MTSFVDLDPAHAGGLLGLAPRPVRRQRPRLAGVAVPAVRGWDRGVVAVEPSAPFAGALREVLPHATLVVDPWHLHQLGTLMLTQVRQRVTQHVHGHRGRLGADSWAYRRLLLRGARHLSDKQWRRLRELFGEDDPTGQIKAAWAGKGLLRQLLEALPAVDGPLVTDARREPSAPAQAAAPARSSALRDPRPARAVLPPGRPGRRPRADSARDHD